MSFCPDCTWPCQNTKFCPGLFSIQCRQSSRDRWTLNLQKLSKVCFDDNGWRHFTINFTEQVEAMWLTGMRKLAKKGRTKSESRRVRSESGRTPQFVVTCSCFSPTTRLARVHRLNKYQRIVSKLIHRIRSVASPVFTYLKLFQSN